MQNATKAWTYLVAYLSLAVGAGVSIAGNVADTYRTSSLVHHVPDGLDITISAFWPAAVLLAIEMFVSRLWPKTTPMQMVRWFGSLAIGFVAMYSSWHHLADLLASRGQDALVANLGPLAIDGLAIMATGLILSSRGHKLDAEPWQDVHVTTDAEMAALQAEQDAYLISDSSLRDTALDGQALANETQSYLDRLAYEVQAETTPAFPLDVVPVSPAPQGNEVKRESVPAMAADLIMTWYATADEDRPAATDVDQYVAGLYGKHPRTARRWRYALKPE